MSLSITASLSKKKNLQSKEKNALFSAKDLGVKPYYQTLGNIFFSLVYISIINSLNLGSILELNPDCSRREDASVGSTGLKIFVAVIVFTFFVPIISGLLSVASATIGLGIVVSFGNVVAAICYGLAVVLLASYIFYQLKRTVVKNPETGSIECITWVNFVARGILVFQNIILVLAKRGKLTALN